MSVVLAQPHRNGSTDERCASALGRLCMARGLDPVLQHAGDDYASLVRRWRAAKGIPTQERVGAGSGLGPSDKTVREWGDRLIAIRDALDRISPQVRIAVRRLVIDDVDLERGDCERATRGLRELAFQFGRVVRRHPFESQRIAA